MKIKKQANKTTMKAIMLALFTILLAVSATAIPTPKGIDGKIYYLDGLTEVFPGVPVEMVNLDTGEVLLARTGKGSPGRYSAALQWENGANIVVSAYNPFNNASRNITLQGVMRDIDLYLNMSFPNLPPNITSKPVTNASAKMPYNYKIEAFDWNSDPLLFSLEKHPGGMSIDKDAGLITWIPERSQAGFHNIIISVSDHEFTVYQEFAVFVSVTNKPPKITSEPITSVQAPMNYYYNITVLDEDSEFLELILLEGPSGMFFNGTVLSWKALPMHAGEHFINVKAIDMFGLHDYQNFTLEVLPPGPPQSIPPGSARASSGTLARDASASPIPLTGTSNNSKFVFNEKGIPLRNVLSKQDNSPVEVFVSLIDPGTIGIRVLDRVSYAYLSINPDKNVSGKILISFVVEKQWLYQRNLSFEDVVLAKNQGDEWEELPTSLSGEDEEYYFFDSESHGFSLFAITTKKSSLPAMPSPIARIIPDAFMVIGTIIGGLASHSNIIVTVTNLVSGESFEAETKSFPDGSVRYQASVHGEKGDSVRVMASWNGRTVTQELFLENTLNKKDVTFQDHRMTGISGLVSSAFGEGSFFILIITLFMLVAYTIYRKTSRKGKEGGK